MCAGLPGYGNVPRPRQSYEFAGTEEVAVDARASVMLAQRLRGVIRCFPLQGTPEASLLTIWHGSQAA